MSRKYEFWLYTFMMWISSRYLAFGVAFSLPFLTANTLVVMQEEFFLSILRPKGVKTSFEQILVLALITLVGIGGLLALLPMLRHKRVYIVNAIVGAVFIVFALFSGYELGKDFYHCDILKIPNCD